MCSFNRLPKISKCCYFIGLRSGVYLIGLIQLVFGLASMIYLISNSTVKNQRVDHDNAEQNQEFSPDFFIYLAVSSVFMFLGVLLVLGVRIKNVMLVKLYIVFEIIALIIGLIIYVIILLYFMLAFAIAASNTTNFVGDFIKLIATAAAEELVVLIVISFAVIVLKVYFLVCVISYLKELIQLKNGTPQAVAYTAITEKDDNITKYEILND